MATTTSTEQFRAVLQDDNKFSELIEHLGGTDLIPLLVKYKGLEKIEGDELKGKLRGKLGRERNNDVIRRIMEKNTHTSYSALSQVIQFKNEYIWAKLFPFAKGTHSTLSIQPGSLFPRLIQPAAEQPAVIWLCADEDVFKFAANNFVKSHAPLKKTLIEAIQYYELPQLTDYDIKVWLCMIRPINMKADTMSKFYKTYCNAKYCIFTGECKAINDPHYQLGDICITKQSKHSMKSFIATIEHLTIELSQPNNDQEYWFCKQRSENDKSVVVFGEVGNSVLDNTADFISNDGYQFCHSSEQAYSKGGVRIQHVAILLASEDNSKSNNKSTECECGQRNISHMISYSYELIKHLVTKISIQKARCGRNPSV